MERQEELDFKELTPYEYFKQVKELRNQATDELLQSVYDNAAHLMQKALITGQVKAARKLMFHLDSVTKERQIVQLGVDTFVYRKDIEEYIDHVAKNVVKIIELENYEREIPDEIVEVIERTKGIFDRMYVVFTDYTDGKLEKEIIKERDPILFGTFQSRESKMIVDRFYYLGDWVDEYCDLTLGKMVAEMKKAGHGDISIGISTPASLDELRNQLSKLEEKQDHRTGQTIYQVSNVAKKQSFFDKVKSVFRK